MSESETSEISRQVDHVKTSVGGLSGHILRRGIHLSMAVIPYLYYEHGESIASPLNLNPEQVVSAVVLLLCLAEYIRLKIGFTVIGQREYEARQISAMAWGGFAVAMALLLSPSEALGYAIIISLTLGDPILGELRRAGKGTNAQIGITAVVLMAVWLAFAWSSSIPLILALVMPFVCIAGEWPRLNWIDDNATMIFVPLGFVLILNPWF